MIAVIAILALIGALAGVAKASSERLMGRWAFAKFALLAWAPILLLVALDFVRFQVLDVSLMNALDVISKNATPWLVVWLLLTSYPLFTRVAWRLNDASKGRFWGYVAVVPYVNIFIFVYLCLLPSKTDTSQGAKKSSAGLD